MKNHKSNSHVKIIFGRKAWMIQKWLAIYLFWEVFKINRNLASAIREIRHLRKLRSLVHGNQRITKFAKSDKLYYWVTDYPGLPSGNLKNMVQLEFLRNKINTDETKQSLIPQQTIIWGITNRCSLQCSHCYDWDNIDNKDHLTSEQLKQILKKIEEQGIRHVQLSGGEPLSRFDDMISILNEASERIDFWLLTSGFGLTPEKAIALREAGLRGVNISLDHWDESKHNLFRNNPKSYAWVMKAITNCRNAGLIVSLSLCATREFVDEVNLEKYLELAKNMGAHFIRILEPRQVGRFSNQKVKLEKEQIELLSQFTIRINNDLAYKKFPIIVFFGYHQRKLGCMGAGNRYLYIDANGDFHACPFCRGAKGNALHDSFNESILKLRETGCHAFKSIS